MPDVVEEAQESQEIAPVVVDSTAPDTPKTPFDEPEDEPEAAKPNARASRTKPSRIPEEARGALPFPYAPRSVAKDGTISEEKFFPYWYKLPKHVEHRQEIYIQRQWPVLDYSKMLSQEQVEAFERLYPIDKRKPGDIDAYLRKCGITKYLEKYDRPYASKDYREEICRRWGDGDYKFFLNDVGVPGNPNLKRTTLCTTIVRIRADVPPVLDINLLSMTDPANAGFIEQRRLRGLPLPGDAQLQEEKKQAEDEDMSAVTAQILDDNRQMRQEVIQLAKDARKEAPQQAAAPSADVTAMGTATSKALDLLADANKKALDIAARANDPQAYVDNALRLAEHLNSGKQQESGGSTEMLRLMLEQQRQSSETLLKMQMQHSQDMLAMQQKAHEAELASLNARFADLERRLSAPQATATGATVTAAGGNSIGDLLKAFKEVRKFADEISGPSAEASDLPGWAGLVERVAPQLAEQANTFMANLANYRAGKPAIEVAADDSTEVATTEAKEDPKTVREKFLAGQIKPYVEQALQAKYKGYEFGGNVIASYGMEQYLEFASGGETGLTAFLMRTGLHGGLVSRFGAQQVGEFISEFVDQPRSIEVAKQMNPAKANGAPAAASKGPRVNPAPPATQ